MEARLKGAIVKSKVESVRGLIADLRERGLPSSLAERELAKLLLEAELREFEQSNAAAQ